MKFLGKFVSLFDAVFKKDVTLDGVSTGTIASGGNLGLDSNNKIVKNTVSSGTTDLTSDVTGVLPIANGGTNSNSAASARTALGVDAAGTDNSTNVTLAGTPDYITISGQEITRNQIDLANDVTGTLAASNVATLNQDTTGSAATLTTPRGFRTNLASTSGVNFDGSSDVAPGVDGILPVANGGTGQNSLGSVNISSFNNDSGFTANTGDITQFKFTADDGSGSATTVTAGDVEITFSGGEGIDTSVGSTSTVTISAEDASDSNKGIVELATTAEADTGTDTTRAVTPAGLKSHVDARFSYQYISFTGNATVPSDGDWMTVSANGISNHLFNINLGSGGTTIDTSVAWNNVSNTSSKVGIPTNNICQGIVVPFDCTLVGYASLIRSVGNHQSKVGLAVGVPIYNDFESYDATLVAVNLADSSAGPDTNYSQRPTRADYLTANAALPAGYVIHPLIGSVASNSRVVQWNCTIVLKTLLP